jgi:hypothetical protein
MRGLLLLLGLLCIALPAVAQTGQFSGTVTDPSAARVPSAQIQIVNQATSVELQTVTNADGAYVFPFVRPGSYKIFVKASGFKTTESEPLTVSAGQKQVFDAQLSIGVVEDTVTVTGVAPLMNTQDAAIGFVVEQAFIENMPLNGRSFQDLIALAPGVLTVGSSYGGGGFSVNGQRTETNAYIVDGVSANVANAGGYACVGCWGAPLGSKPALSILGTTQSLLSADAMEEMRIETSSYSAEHGRYPGGQFSFTSRAGTNSYHGSAYDYFRNDALDANNWFANREWLVNNRQGRRKAAMRQNDFGVTFGGPVAIPGLYDGKGRTFFFVSYEGLRLVQPQGANTGYVPSLALRQDTRAPEIVRQVWNAIPEPTGPETQVACSDADAYHSCAGQPVGTLVPSGAAPYFSNISSPKNIDAISVRLDHNLSSRMNVFFRWNYSPSSSTSRGTGTEGSGHSDTSTYTWGAINQFSSKSTNDFRFNYSHSTGTDQTITTSGLNLGELIGLTGAYADLYADTMINFGNPNADGFGMETIRSGTETKQWNLVDTISVLVGNHQFKFGTDYRHLYFPQHPAPRYWVTFPDIPRAFVNHPNYMMLMKEASPQPAQTEFSLFAQDEWRVTDRLNLSFGLRWEVAPAPRSASGPDDLPALWNTSWFNFAPRLGAAYRLRTDSGWETVVRVGGGVFFDNNNGLAGMGIGAGGGTVRGFYGTNFDPDDTTTTMTPEFIQSRLDEITFESGSNAVFPRHLQLPYTLQWNVSVQQALGGSQTLTAAYVAAVGRRLAHFIGDAGKETGIVVSDGTSDYHALQLQFQRSVSRGVQALAGYTWAHCIDTASHAWAGVLVRGNCESDVRHNFQASVMWSLPRVNYNRFTDTVLSNWGLDIRFMARTAFPVNVTAPNWSFQVNGFWPDPAYISPGEPVYVYDARYPGGRAFNPAAFCDPNVSNCAASSYVVPRNSIRGFGENQINLAMRRDVALTEGTNLQFRWEAFNVLNHPNFGGVNGGVGSDTFGQATSMLSNNLSGLNAMYQQGGARSMQFMLKLQF